MGVSRLMKAEYVFRPSTLLRRLTRGKRPFGEQELRLPWGWPILVNPHEKIGKAIDDLGLYDLVLTEAIFRLLPPGGNAVDVGANLGCMTAAMAYVAGVSGSVMAFEPHPSIFARLQRNTELWSERGASIRCSNVAASDVAGESFLILPDEFAQNEGLGRVGTDTSGRTLPITCVRLDDYIAAGTTIDVMKLDVEGHEPNVLRGAARLLSDCSIRNVLFEEHAIESSEAATILRRYGFEIFSLRRALLGPSLDRHLEPCADPVWEAANFLATRNVAAAVASFSSSGWRAL